MTAVATLLAPSRAHAICAGVDFDGDGFFPAGSGCLGVPDCAPFNAMINPGSYEDSDTEWDDNCNARTALMPLWTETHFPGTQWHDIGTVIHLVGLSDPFDQIAVGTTGSAASSSSSRSLGALSLNVSVAVAVKVAGDVGTGGSCSLSLGTRPSGGGATAWANKPLSGVGVQLLSFAGIVQPGRVLTDVQVMCPAHRKLTLDWIQVQDHLEVAGPLTEASFAWKDTRNPGADAPITMIVDDIDGNVWFGTDTSGVALKDGSGWHPQNGYGDESLVMGGSLGASDILPLPGSAEVWVLGGDESATGPVGGLWRSADDGEHWEQLGSSLPAWPPTTSPPATVDHTDDVAAYNLESNNYSAFRHGPRWEHGGGRHLQSHGIPAVAPSATTPLYIANGDWDNLGVSLYDGTRVCPMPTTGDALPADRVGALLRIDVPITLAGAIVGTEEALVVGYRGRLNAEPSLYVCDVTGGVDCTSGAAADCQIVELGDAEGADIRDFQEDTYSSGIGAVEVEEGLRGVLLADGGSRPIDTNSDGLGDLDCDRWTDTNADDKLDTPNCLFEPGVHYLTLEYDGGLVPTLDAYLVDWNTLPQLNAQVDQLTGISIDPDSSYVFVNVPGTGGYRYAFDRIYRAPVADFLDDAASADWQPINEGEAVLDDSELDDDEARRDLECDYSGSWAEAEWNGVANPFPARAAPGKTVDIAWIEDPTEPGPVALVGSAVNVWRVLGLTDEWDDDDADGTIDAEGEVEFTFWPDIRAAGNTFQGWPTMGVAVDPYGNIWAASGDQALSHLDMSEPFDPLYPNGAEVDCLWHGWQASATSVTVVQASEPTEFEMAAGNSYSYYLPVVWATLGEHAASGNLQNIGVIRSLDIGASWQYAAAGWGAGVDDGITDGTDPDYGRRYCQDMGTVLPDHYASQFESVADSTTRPPSNAFSTGDPSLTEELIDPATLSLGAPTNIRALNEYAAVVLFNPTNASSDGADPTPVTDGGLYLTIDGGSTWHPVEFDGGVGDLVDTDGDDATPEVLTPCDERTSLAWGGFELIHPGVDSVWDPLTGEATFDLLFTVADQPFSVSAAAGTSTRCSLARVVIQAAPGDPDPIGATWSWYTYPALLASHQEEDGYCGVAPSVLTGAVPSLTNNEAMVFGSYLRQGGGDWRNAYGGACLFDVDDADLTSGSTQVVDPFFSVVGIGAVASHPQVADLWAILPTFDAGTSAYCNDYRTGWFGEGAALGADLACAYPWPLILQGTASGYTVTPTLGPDPAGPPVVPAGTPFVPVSYPVGRVSSAVWSELGVPDDSADGQGSYLIVGTVGQGAWRGEMTW